MQVDWFFCDQIKNQTDKKPSPNADFRRKSNKNNVRRLADVNR